jgi:hypothetical protein
MTTQTRYYMAGSVHGGREGVLISAVLAVTVKAETTLPAVREILPAISTASPSSDDVDSSSSPVGGSGRGGIAASSGTGWQARRSGAAAIPAVNTAPSAVAVSAPPSATTTTPAAPASGAATAPSGGSAALGTTVVQSVSAGIRLTTAPPAPAAVSHASGGHTLQAGMPDTGAYNETPNRSSAGWHSDVRDEPSGGNSQRDTEPTDPDKFHREPGREHIRSIYVGLSHVPTERNGLGLDRH